MEICQGPSAGVERTSLSKAECEQMIRLAGPNWGSNAFKQVAETYKLWASTIHNQPAGEYSQYCPKEKVGQGVAYYKRHLSVFCLLPLEFIGGKLIRLR